MPAQPPSSPGAAVRREALARGASAETLVADALEARGWTILARNWRGQGGELDIVALKEGRLRIVEVKLRAAGDLVGLEAIDHRKQARLRRAAEAWLSQTDVDYDEVCFAVAWLEGGELTWIDDAFDGR